MLREAHLGRPHWARARAYHVSERRSKALGWSAKRPAGQWRSVGVSAAAAYASTAGPAAPITWCHSAEGARGGRRWRARCAKAPRMLGPQWPPPGHGRLVSAQLGFNVRAERGGDGSTVEAAEANGELQGPHASRLLGIGVLEDPHEQVD